MQYVIHNFVKLSIFLADDLLKFSEKLRVGGTRAFHSVKKEGMIILKLGGMAMVETNRNRISLFGFFALTAALVMTSYEYPTFATSKLHLIFFVLVGGIFWFFPVALTSAEMASIEGWEEGGIFSWVSHAIGKRWGLAAVFYEWYQGTLCNITMLYFVVGAFSIVFHIPILEENLWVKFLVVAGLYWLLTLLQFRGVKSTVKLAQVGVVLGIIMPTVLFLILAIIYAVKGYPLQIQFNWHDIIPNFHELSTLVVAASFVLAFGGIEASASHVNEMENPRRNYPLAILLLAIVTIVLDGVGGLSVAMVTPAQDLSLSAGVVQAFEYLLRALTTWWRPILVVITLCLILGEISQVSSWIVGPTKTLYIAAREGLLPPTMRHINEEKVPTHLLILQGVVVTIWAAILTFGGGSGNVSFFVSISLTAVIYLCAYILMFISYFRVIFHFKDLPRMYQIPGGSLVKSLVALSGLILSIFSFFIAFVKPSALSEQQGVIYQVILMLCFVLMFISPFVLYGFRHRFMAEDDQDGYKIVGVTHQDINPLTPPKGRSSIKIVKR